MRLALSQPSSDGYRASLRQRGPGVALALAVEILILLALLTLGTRQFFPHKPDNRLTTFQLEPPPVKTMGSSSPQKAARARPAEHSATPPPLPIPAPSPPVTKPTPTPDLLKLSKDDYAAMDISKMSPKGNAGSGSGTGTGKAPYGPGEGPDGMAVYNAEWYREPTRAELATYMPKRIDKSGYGSVICRMIAGYHVENCREAGETPGSGLARAMRLASWQFLIRPPRVGTKSLIGEWVKVTYYLTVTTDKSATPEAEDTDPSR